MSLRTFHLLFILFAIMGADLFGGWAVRHFVETRDATILSLGVLSMVGGLGLALYALFFVRRLDREHIR